MYCMITCEAPSKGNYLLIQNSVFAQADKILSIANLGAAYSKQGQLELAEVLSQQALKLRK
jgi:hypothetical protein